MLVRFYLNRASYLSFSIVKYSPVTDLPKFNFPFPQDSESYLSEQIITYLGNKRSLLSLIGEGLQHAQTRLNKEKLVCLDLFSGSGIVSRFLKAFSQLLIVNDLESYSRIINNCYLTNSDVAEELELDRHHRRLIRYIHENLTPGLIAEHYAPQDDDSIQKGERVFYSRKNAIYLDTARRAIDLLPEELRVYFIAPLLSQASVHTNTSGVFKGFYKNGEGIGQFGGSGKNALQRILRPIELPQPIFSRYNCDTEIYCEDANSLIDRLPECDIAYLDPPYNQHPYGSNYFMLNVLANYDIPSEISQVSGIPNNWNRSHYNVKNAAAKALFNLIERCPAKFILLSYSSEGFINYDEMMAFLKTQGRLDVLETNYSAFKASRNFRNRPKTVTEFLFLLEKF